MLAYTSGTTGQPKGVPLTHANVLSSMRAAMLAWRWSPDDILVHALPLSHQHGLGGVHMTLLAGSRAVIAGRFDPAALCAAVRDHHATVLMAVPAMYVSRSPGRPRCRRRSRSGCAAGSAGCRSSAMAAPRPG
jgi:malonyl-CoA/methylmalonyl-CoA synthetase